METNTRVQVVVATRNRPELLSDLLDAITWQSVPIERVILVDSSDRERQLTSSDVETFRKVLFPIEVIYEISLIGSLPYQRNRGLELVDWEKCDYVLFLDDDTRPESSYIEKILSVLAQDEYSVGGSGVTGPPPAKIEGVSKWLREIFFLYSDKGGRVLTSGVNLAVNEHGRGPQMAEWIFGCSIWKAKIFKHVHFPDNLPGGALCEDVIFSMNARRYGNLWVEPSAILTHLLSGIDRPDEKLDAIRKVRNRFEVVKLKKPKVFAVGIFWWSNVGQFLLLARHGLPFLLGNGRSENERYANALKGHLIGSLMVITGKDPI